MFGIHVGLNFKYEAGKFGFGGHNITRLRGSQLWLGCPLNKVIQHFPHTKITECGSEEYGGLLSL